MPVNRLECEPLIAPLVEFEDDSLTVHFQAADDGSDGCAIFVVSGLAIGQARY